MRVECQIEPRGNCYTNWNSRNWCFEYIEGNNREKTAGKMCNYTLIDSTLTNKLIKNVGISF